MIAAERARLLPLLRGRRELVAERWQRAVAPAGFVAVSAEEVRRLLTALTDRAITLLLTDAFDPAAARWIGAALAGAHYIQPDALGATLRVLTQELLAAVPAEPAAGLLPRLGELLGAVAAGFSRQAGDIVLAEQEEIRGALLEQRQEALAALAQQYAAAERVRSELRAVLDAAGDAMLLVAPDRRLVMVNRRFEELFGLDERDVVGRTLGEMRDRVERIFADVAGVQAVFDLIADTERQVTQEVAQRWPEPRALRLFSTPVRAADGASLGRLHVYRDVTAERAVDRMQRQFVSQVSHELRTPLTSIKGYVDLLLGGDVGDLTDDQKDFLAIVKHNTDRQLALINDLLDLSRIEAGKIEVRRRLLHLSPVLQQVARSLRPQVTAKRHRLTLDLAPALPPVEGDAGQLAQIFSNLLANAHQYTPDGGAIMVTARAAAGRVQVAVRDTGIGLAPEDQARVFDKFFRATNRATQGVRGTGLGLAITRALVELHGGEVGVESVLGEGSTFTVSLPAGVLAPGPANAAQDAADTALVPTTGEVGSAS